MLQQVLGQSFRTMVISIQNKLIHKTDPQDIHPIDPINVL